MKRQEIIEQLAERGSLPWRALSFCLDNPEACVPAFLLLLERQARDLPLSLAERQALFYGIHLLGKFQVPEAFAPLRAVLCEDEQRAASLVGDAIADTIPRVLMSLASGQAETLWDVVATPQIDWIVREAFLRCWTYGVLCGELPMDTAEEKLRNFPTTVAPEPDNFLWSAWMTSIADLGLSSLAPQVERIFASGQIERDALGFLPSDLAVFQADLKEARRIRRRAQADRLAFAQTKGYAPFTGTHEEFIRAARHVLTEAVLLGDDTSSPGLGLRAADRKPPFDGSPPS